MALEGDPIRLSIIIPALDEAVLLQAALPRLLTSWRAGTASGAGRTGQASVYEVIVVDGGSSDGTAEVAASLGARVVRASRGRGIQLDAGARAAAGDAFLFLHADSTPPAGFAGDIERALSDPRVTFGAFRLGFAAEGARFRLLERATDLRIALTRTPYGDQGLFCRRGEYFRCGGFPPWPLLEDLSFMRRMRRLHPDRGGRTRAVILPGRTLTSARRYQTKGFLRALARNRAASLLWALHVPPGLILSAIGLRSQAGRERTLD